MPKLLSGMNQKVWGGIFLWDLGIRRHQAPGGKAGPKPIV